MRIAFVTETWLPSSDGVVTRLTATARELAGLGHQILVIAPRGPDRRQRDVRFPGVVVRTVPALGVPFIYAGKPWGLPTPQVGRWLRQFCPDVVHTVNPALLGIAGVIAARRQGRALVASYHTDLTEHAVHYHLGWLRPVIWALLRALHGRARISLATSTAASDNLARHGVADVRLWPRGVDLRLFRPGEPGPRDRTHRPVALYVGRLAGEKGLHRLAVLAEPDSGFDLVIAGDGPDRDDLMRRFSSPTVQFTGTLHGEALAQVYRDADVFVFPSTTETLGLVLLEALASGLPIVAAHSPASRELLAGTRSARLFPPDRPRQILPLAVELCSVPREIHMAAGRSRAQGWRWEDATAKLIQYYDEAISSTRSTGRHAGSGSPG